MKICNVHVHPFEGELHLRAPEINKEEKVEICYNFKGTLSQSLGDLVGLIDETDYEKFKDVLELQRVKRFTEDLTHRN